LKPAQKNIHNKCWCYLHLESDTEFLAKWKIRSNILVTSRLLSFISSMLY